MARPSTVEVIHTDDAERVRGSFAELLAGKPFNTCENRNYTRTGDVVHVEWYNSTLLDESGRLICVMSLGHDVSAREREEEQRRRLEDQVRQSQKMEAVGRLAGGVAHDFNNLLTVINGCSELMLQENGTGESTRELAKEINRAGEQAATLTKQLLAFGRRQITAPVSLDLNDVIRDVERCRRLSASITLDVEPRPGLPGKADPADGALRMNRRSIRDAMLRGGAGCSDQHCHGKVVLTVADTASGGRGQGGS